MSLPKKLQFSSPLKLATVALSGGENNRKMPEKCIFPSNFAATTYTQKNPSTKNYSFVWVLHPDWVCQSSITTIIPPCTMYDFRDFTDIFGRIL